MDVSYSTAGTAAFERKRYWDEAVSSTYFPLDLRFQNAQAFSGELNVWDLGNVSLSRLESDGLLYRRQKRHLLHEREENYLITVPKKAEISFEQSGKALESSKQRSSVLDLLFHPLMLYVGNYLHGGAP